MNQLAHTVLGVQCASLPWLAWSPAACTDYSDTLNFSLSILSSNRCGKPFRLSLSVRSSLFQACHGFVTNGKTCAPVRMFNSHLFIVHHYLCSGSALFSFQILSILRRVISSSINTTYFNHVHLIQKGVFVWQ